MSPFYFKEGEHGRLTRQEIKPGDTVLSPKDQAFIQVFPKQNLETEAVICFPECTVGIPQVATAEPAKHRLNGYYQSQEFTINTPQSRTTIIWEPTPEETERILVKEVDSRIPRKKEERYHPLSLYIDSRIRHHSPGHAYMDPRFFDEIGPYLCQVVRFVEKLTYTPLHRLIDYSTGYWAKEKDKIKQNFINSEINPNK